MTIEVVFVSVSVVVGGVATYALFQLSRTYWDLPFVETRENTAEDMLSLLNVRPGERTVDLGAGDGRLVIALAKAGADAHGFETNIFLVWRARRRIRMAGVGERAHIHWKNFWHADLAPFSAVTVFGIEPVMERLEKKLRKELPPGARVASNYFAFPSWSAAGERNDVRLYRQS